MKSKNATYTRLETNKDATIKRYYYLDIRKCLDPLAGRLEAIVSVSEKKQCTTDIGRTATLDLSTREKEFENLMFPLNITFSHNGTEDWHYDMEDYYKNDREYRNLFRDFSQQILRPILEYNMPVIQLDKDTPKEVACQIFENVNTGGVPLTVFKLVTVTFCSWWP